jgi:hypothetical protein
MTPAEYQDELLEVQKTIDRVALSLDSFLVNGIQYGVLNRAVSGDILRQTANRLKNSLLDLNMHSDTAVTVQAKVNYLISSLWARCEEVITVVNGLSSFRWLPLHEVRATVSRIPALRRVCIDLIQELEQTVRTRKSSRPDYSTAAVNTFLESLEQLFADEWTAANPPAGAE